MNPTCVSTPCPSAAPLPLRRCTHCKRTPEEVEFRRDKRVKRDGLNASCAPCATAYSRRYYAAKGEQVRADNNKRYHARKDRYLAQQRQARLANLDVVRARDRARSAGDPVRIARSRRWRLDNLDRYRAVSAAWYQANKDRAVTYATRRRMRKRGSTGRIERISPRAVWARDRGICQLCARPVSLREMEVDHIKPLARGGEHTFSNVWASHRPCNRRKHSKVVPRWAYAPAPAPIIFTAQAPTGQLSLFAAA